MNRLGVGIASDSMTTLTGQKGQQKRFTDARKIFAIGPEHKVIVLAYGNMDVNGAPIWTLLTQWAKTISQPLARVHNYAESFLDFARYHPSLDEESLKEVDRRVQRKLGYLGYEIDQYAKDNAELEIAEIEKAALKWIKEHRDIVKNWTATPDFTFLSQNNLSSIRNSIKTYLSEVFVEEYYTPKLVKALADLGFELLTKADPVPNNPTGLVFVGYGQEDFDPALSEMNVECFYYFCFQGELVENQEIPNRSMPGRIHTYAQDSAINAFLNGQSFDAELRMGTLIETAFDQNQPLLGGDQDYLGQTLQSLKDSVSRAVRDELATISGGTMERFRKSVRAMDVTAMSEFAESLVNLEAMSGLALDDDATVGGFVQVLTIDPHEGIRWRKRLDPNGRY